MKYSFLHSELATWNFTFLFTVSFLCLEEGKQPTVKHRYVGFEEWEETKKESSTTLLARCFPPCYEVTSADKTQSCD